MLMMSTMHKSRRTLSSSSSGSICSGLGRPEDIVDALLVKVVCPGEAEPCAEQV